ncbi:pyrroloquinoline quinone precursor peptide PqqA [Ancylobacter gelatini]
MRSSRDKERQEEEMAWNTPRIVEVCVGMEVNAYYPADF